MKFEVVVTDEDRLKFADLSGDINPLHVDAEYASKSSFKRCILHGAFGSGLLSRMAGMYLPGKKCLLVDIKMKFISPIFTPSTLIVSGDIKREDPNGGLVEVKILDKSTGKLLTEGSYSFLYHETKEKEKKSTTIQHNPLQKNNDVILVTGASGGLGQSLLSNLGEKAIGVSTSNSKNCITLDNYRELRDLEVFKNIKAIVHCASPSPDNIALSTLEDPENAIKRHISRPLEDVIALSKLLIKNGTDGSQLIIIGSSISSPGRHKWSMPLYSLSKSLVPNLTKILALELSRSNRKIIGVTYEMLDGGMNSNLSNIHKRINSDRMLRGELTSMKEASLQVKWILENPSYLISGSVIDCRGAAIP